MFFRAAPPAPISAKFVHIRAEVEATGSENMFLEEQCFFKVHVQMLSLHATLSSAKDMVCLSEHSSEKLHVGTS